MKKAIIAIVISLVPALVTAQKWNVSAEVFYGTFKMKSMKDYQNNVSALQSPFQGRVVDDFPAYIGYNFLAGYNITPGLSLGLRLQYTSTGGRLDYGDYSGRITDDQRLHAYSLGVNTTCRLTHRTTWQTYFSFTVGAARTSLNLAHYSQRLDESYSYNMYFRSFNYFFNPALTFNRKINSHFSLYASLGVEFQIHRALRHPQDRKAYVKTSNNMQEAIAEWDGVRLGAGMSYRFSLRNKKEI
jgi:opacity protein-like surface antigen